MPIAFILFGNMCSGKSTIGQILKNERGYAVVAAKEVIQKNLETADEAVKRLRAQGYLLPDELVIDWIYREIDRQIANGRDIILDGFPRTEYQARRVLKDYGHIGKVVYLDFNLDIIQRRFEHRVLCDTCSMPYSRLFSDFRNECFYCHGRSFSPRPTDRPDYFAVKTAQYRSESVQVLPVLQGACLKFATVGDHSSFGALRTEVLTLLS